ncbi:MAG TPA: glycerophosphodiester phosphodiesterase [Solirubrobacterales bacterium]|nr:glycerophosphodiester phosphodiesterase [Solirubrobacterales bacterium]
MKRIGHKGADAVVRGNTLDSFRAAVELGVDMIEFDVLRLHDGSLVIAHDHIDAQRREPIPLAECLDAFVAPPLDRVELDCDLKKPGGEQELAAALRERGLLARAMVSTMEVSSLGALRRIEPTLRLGWTYPKVKRGWTGRRWARPGVVAALRVMRARLPRTAARALPRLDVQAMWVYWPLIGRRLLEVARSAGVSVNAWTVDDADRLRALDRLGVDGICTNDPRLFSAPA